jgi:hypothetical protein
MLLIAMGRNPLFIKEFFLTHLSPHMQHIASPSQSFIHQGILSDALVILELLVVWQGELAVAILYSSRNSF